MTDLKNQSSYLGSDLNPNGISSLKPEAAKFNTRAKELFGKIDVVNKAFGDYVDLDDAVATGATGIGLLSRWRGERGWSSG